MSRLSFDQLSQSLHKGTVAPCYYLHGGEAILKDAALALILDTALEPGTRDFNLDTLSAQQLDPAGLPAACATLPMMAPYRVVVLRDVEAWKRKSKAKQPALQYLDHPLPETVLVMVQGTDDDPDDELASRATAVACVALVGDQLDAWLDRQLAAHQVQLAPAAREHLLRVTAGELGPLSAEIHKLSGLDSTTPIDAATVGALAGVRFGETPEDWRDAVLRDDHASALRLVPRLLEQSGISGVSLVTLLGTSLLLVAWARRVAQQRKTRGTALAESLKRQVLFPLRLRVGSYDPFSRLVSEVVGQWPLPRVRAAVQATLDADITLKSSGISDDNGVMTDLVLTLAATRARRAA